MRRNIALITGVTGQDGSYLSGFLLARGYDVHGLRLYSATNDLERLPDSIRNHSRFHLHTGDLADSSSLQHLLKKIEPDEIYNLGAQSHVGVSFTVPEQTANLNALGPLRLLEAIRLLGLEHKTRFYQASSSEMFGNATAPQSESTPFAPQSPYAAAKLYAYWLVRMYRHAYGLYASNGILFNHESPLRGECFVTRKIARAVALDEPLALGNLNAVRDWGHAHDYVRGMWLMLQQDKPDDYILATGQTRTVRDFVNAAYAHRGISLRWAGKGMEEQGLCARTGRVLVTVDPSLFRPVDVDLLCGDASKARKNLGWEPEINFTQLVAEMVDSEREGQSHVSLAAE